MSLPEMGRWAPQSSGIARPAWLGKAAREIWDRLLAGGTAAHFKANDANAFAHYCVYMANWIDANKKLTTLGDETATRCGEILRFIHPHIHSLRVLRDRIAYDLVKLECDLGLPPGERIRIMQQMAATAGQQTDNGNEPA